ncbi:MAG: hypothetical protein V1869_06110 [Candidatus Omnitrophota bacterium]
MKKTVICFALISGFALIAYGGQISRIELNDGSVIEGEVVSLDNGAYILNSGSLGKIRVEATRVKRIEAKTQNPDPAGNLPPAMDQDLIKSEINQTRKQIVDNPEIMRIVNELANDPDFQEAMKDPGIVKAAKSQDVKALISNEKFMNLIKNAKIKEIENKLQN